MTEPTLLFFRFKNGHGEWGTYKTEPAPNGGGFYAWIHCHFLRPDLPRDQQMLQIHGHWLAPDPQAPFEVDFDPKRGIILATRGGLIRQNTPYTWPEPYMAEAARQRWTAEYGVDPNKVLT